MLYEVLCSNVAIGGVAFYTFPTGCRVSAGSLTRRENLVHIPHAPGTKDIGDGTLEGGDVTVEGRIWAATAPAAAALIHTMEDTLLGHASAFYVGQSYGSDNTEFYPVHGCKSVAHNIPDGPGGKWIDVACVFSRGPDPAMVTGI